MAVSIYSNTGSLSVGSQVFLKHDLTTPAFDGIYSDGVNYYTCAGGVITSIAACPVETTTTTTVAPGTTTTTTVAPGTTTTTTLVPGTTTTTTLANVFGFNLSYDAASCDGACGSTPATTTTTVDPTTPTTTVVPSTTSTTTQGGSTPTTTLGPTSTLTKSITGLPSITAQNSGLYTVISGNNSSTQAIQITLEFLTQINTNDNVARASTGSEWDAVTSVIPISDFFTSDDGLWQFGPCSNPSIPGYLKYLGTTPIAPGSVSISFQKSNSSGGGGEA